MSRCSKLQDGSWMRSMKSKRLMSLFLLKLGLKIHHHLTAIKTLELTQ
jgi:hypothetical protein